SALLKKIKKGDIAAIIFFLKTQGRNRGYSERHEINLSDNASVPTEARQAAIRDPRTLQLLRESVNGKSEGETNAPD
ncbi:hypothetical protein GYB59_21655, partial [bacterium]|nr:hypothetical protein [bacterium]